MPTYTQQPLEPARCTECGNEEENVRHAAQANAQPVPVETAAECLACGHRGDPLAFGLEYEWVRLDEETREQRKQNLDRMAAWEASAAYFTRRSG